MKAKPSINQSEMKKISELEEKIIDLQNKLTRSLADYINLEKRIESQRQVVITLATVSIISKMIDVLDDIYLVQSHLKDAGLQMTVDKFKNVLISEGLKEINPQNQEFNPSSMECIQTSDGKDGLVISVKKVGYSLNDQIIRPAQVVVGKKSEILN